MTLAWNFGRGYFLDSPEATRQLRTFLTKSRQRIPIEFEQDSIVQIGDPVITYQGDTAQVVGNVTQVSQNTPSKKALVETRWAEVEFYAAAPTIVDGDYLSYHRTPDSMEWMVQMMLPPKTRNEIGRLIVNAYREHHSELAEVLEPIILKSIRDATDVIREEFNKSLVEREDQIRKLAKRYQFELVERELIPLIQDEIWPIVEEESTPLSLEIGEEIWQQASVWRFGWRILYDRSPLPQRNLVKKEFERFMEEHGEQVMQSYLPEMLQVQQTILTRIAENDEVQKIVADTSNKVFRDPEFQRLATDILRDVFIENDRLTKAFEVNWNSDDARDALEITNQRLEPTITKIGQALFGAPETSITPEFSRVLRNRILDKDERWLVLHLAKPRPSEIGVPRKLAVVPGSTGTENPFHVPKRTEN